MSIVRSHRKRHNFSIVDNSGAEDKNLSWKAKGILWYLLTKPDEWIARREDLIKASPDGKAAVDSGFKELVENGYAFRAMKRNASGQIEWITEVFETKEDAEQWRSDNQDLIATTFTHKKRSNSTVTRKSVNGKPVNGKSVNLVITHTSSDPEVLDLQNSQNTEAESTCVDAACRGPLVSDPEEKTSFSRHVCENEKEIETPWIEKSSDGRPIDQYSGTGQTDPIGCEVIDMVERRSRAESNGTASYAEASEDVKEETTARSGTSLKEQSSSTPWQKSNLEDGYSAAPRKLRKKDSEPELTFHRNGAFSPIGAGKQIQRAVLRSMQVWIWDEWKDCGFRIVRAPDGRIWYFDPKHEEFFSEDELSKERSVTHLVDIANADSSYVGALDLDELNEYAIELFNQLKKDRKLLKRYSVEPVVDLVFWDIEIEDVDWDELPDECYQTSKDALPY